MQTQRKISSENPTCGYYITPVTVLVQKEQVGVDTSTVSFLRKPHPHFALKMATQSVEYHF